MHYNVISKFKLNVQGPFELKGDLLDYILSFFSSNNLIDYYEELDKSDDNISEGAKKLITVNAYERNPLARQKCIDAHGCICSVCGLDFEKMYGDIGRGFIHVHHIVPLSTIGKEYKIDPIKELVPVCPNCHSMLHHGLNGKVLTIDELKRIIQENGY